MAREAVVVHDPPLLLCRRLGAAGACAGAVAGTDPQALRLALGAEERTRLRGLRHSVCGRPLLLQLPRGEALRPGEWLATEAEGPLVLVEAAPEELLLVRAADPQELLRAAYHLGNRHVALEVRASELRLLDDPVLAELLRRRGLALERRLLPFVPEQGAYAGHSHSPGHGHAHPPSSEAGVSAETP
jgi:urease accessory protein